MTPAERLAACQNGTEPRLIAALPSGFLVFNDYQYFPGYCILLANPLVEKLNDLAEESRVQFLSDMSRVGDAVLKVTGAARINYAILGNLDPFLHAHIIPRTQTEDEQYRTAPPFAIPTGVREAEAVHWPHHTDLMISIREALANP